jgi:ketosteroid isomerase-like protein
MTGNLDTARAFFEACETGQGWGACQPYCHPDAGFSAQSGAIAEITTLAAYADWMQGLLTMLTDGSYDLTAFAEDPERATVAACAVFMGTHNGADGPVAATGLQARSDYAYVMKFEDGKISHMSKIWNDGWALKQLGWA